MFTDALLGSGLGRRSSPWDTVFFPQRRNTSSIHITWEPGVCDTALVFTHRHLRQSQLPSWGNRLANDAVYHLEVSSFAAT